MWKGTLALLTCMQLTGCATPFEKMWQGLATCELRIGRAPGLDVEMKGVQLAARHVYP